MMVLSIHINALTLGISRVKVLQAVQTALVAAMVCPR